MQLFESFEAIGATLSREVLTPIVSQSHVIGAEIAAVAGAAAYGAGGGVATVMENIDPITLLYRTAVSLVLGALVALVYRFKSEYSQSLSVTLVLLPAMVQVIIMLAQGSVGVGVAVAGAFSLIRFRSVSGTAREIAHLFFSMSLGFVMGMGQYTVAAIFVAIMCVASLLLTIMKFGEVVDDSHRLVIKIPETLNYDGLFDDLFDKYTRNVKLDSVRTSQMGSLFELRYTIKLKSASVPKEFMDELRVRNGNLNIRISKYSSQSNM